MTLCMVKVLMAEQEVSVCGAPAVARVTVMCVHEHVDTTTMCEKDEAYATDATSRGAVQCALCLVAGHLHVPVTIVERTEL